jgi:hypothetical protein
MKYFNLIVIVFIGKLSFSQVLKGKIVDSITGQPVFYANIVKLRGGGAYADINGDYEIDISTIKSDTLLVTSVGYKNKYVSINALRTNDLNAIFLQENQEELDEVLLTTKKVRYTSKKVFGEKREGNTGMNSLIGYETCVFIKNEENIVGKLNKVYVKLKKMKKSFPDYKLYTAMFNVKIYEFDKEKNTPGKLISKENIYIKPRNAKYTLWVDLVKYNIMVPKEGVCVGLEMINPYGKVRKYDYFGPMYRYTLSKDNKAKTWSNYRDTGWKNGSTKHSRYKRSKAGILNPMIGIEVLFPRK